MHKNSWKNCENCENLQFELELLYKMCKNYDILVQDLIKIRTNLINRINEKPSLN